MKALLNIGLCVLIPPLYVFGSLPAVMAITISPGLRNNLDGQRHDLNLQEPLQSPSVDIKQELKLDAIAREESEFHSRYQHNELVALCEAGFVSGCQSVIEQQRAVAHSKADMRDTPSKPFLEPVLDQFHHLPGSEKARFDSLGLASSSSFFVVTIIAVVVATLLRACWKHRQAR